MESNKLDRWLTIGTNISVLIGIVLLIVEINQNNELVRIQIEQARSDTYVAWQREIALGDHVAPLFAKLGAHDGEVAGTGPSPPRECFQVSGGDPHALGQLCHPAVGLSGEEL